MDDLALDAHPLPVDDPDFPDSAFGSRADVLLDHRGHVPRGERVKIEGILDRKPDDRVFTHARMIA